MAVRNVLKAFRFSRPHPTNKDHNGAYGVQELVFAPGEQEIPDDVLAHPWMKAGADGHIESKEQAEVRIAQQQEQARLADQLAKEANERAEAAFRNLVAAHNRDTPNAPIDEDALNTPLNVLKAQENQTLTSEEKEKLIAVNEENKKAAREKAKKG